MMPAGPGSPDGTAGGPPAGDAGAMASAGAAAGPPIGDLPAAVRSAAESRFRDRLVLAERYARMLATDGVLRGLIGPSEGPRMWERHLLNSAAVADLVPEGASVIDVGSGAGLPGVPLALARPDLTVALLEPMARRTSFLTEVVDALSLADRVTVIRARADEIERRVPLTDVVVARALAPLDRLARWCLPLAAVEGTVLAVKGAFAEREIAMHAAVIRRLGGSLPTLRHCDAGIAPPVTVVEIVRRR